MSSTKTFDKIAFYIALLFKYLHSPHVIKYLLFFFLIKDRKIEVRSKIELSNIEVDLNIGDFIEYWIFMDGLYEKDWVKQAKNYVEGKVFIDIGANIGVYPLSLFKYAKYIYAFEPATQNYKKFVRNLKTNSIKNVKVIKSAVSSKNRRAVKLYLNEADKGQHSLLIGRSSKYESVQTITLDYFIQANHISNIGLIKVDVEGAELDVLKGAVKTIEKLHPPILIEFNRTIALLSGYSLFDLYNFMAQNNYKAYRLMGDSLRKLEKSGIKHVCNENILFI